MGAQEDYNRDVVHTARRLVEAAGLSQLPLVMALRQIAVAMERVGPESALRAIDRMAAGECPDDELIPSNQE